MKAIIEKPLSYCNVPLVIYIYVAILNRITQSNNEEELREIMGLLSIECTGTFDSIFDYGFGSNHMWVSEKESGKRLILVEF